MCLVHIFYCVNCNLYSEIPLYRKQSDFTANIFTDIVCSVPGCSVRHQVLRLPPKFKVNECLNTLCIPDTCSTIVLNKSCRQRWELEPDNFLPVRIVQQRIGVSHESRIYFHFLQS